MKIKVYLFTGFLFFCAFISNAQTALKLGVNLSSMRPDNIDYTENSNACFTQFGLGTKLKKESPGFRAEFLYSVKGRKMESTNTIITSYGSHTYETEVKDKIPYFNVPLLFTFPVVKGLFLEAGPNVGLRLGGKRTMKSTVTFDNKQAGSVFVHNYDETTYRYSDKNAFPNNRLIQDGDDKNLDRKPIKRYDIGLNIGVQYFLVKRMSLSYRYNFGLTDILNDHYLSLNSINENFDSYRSMELCLNFYFGN
jgi:hypothetical protein